MKKMKQFLKQVTQSLSVALFLGFPVAGWSATVSDRPLFVDAVVDHNLIFSVDDSGSMDFEILAPAVGGYGAVDGGWLFNPSYYSNTTERPYKRGLRLGNTGESFKSFSRSNFYLRSSDYNYQYYDPSETYKPWPGYNSKEFGNQSVTSAKLDPGLSNSLTVNLTELGGLGLESSWDGNNEKGIPATLFVINKTAEVFKRNTGGELEACRTGYVGGYVLVPGNIPVCVRCTDFKGNGECKNNKIDEDDYYVREFLSSEPEKVMSCSAPAENLYETWRRYTTDYIFKDSSGNLIPDGQMGFAPDGKCLQRLEFKDEGDNKQEVYEVLNGVDSVDDFFAAQQQNFANWFSYYRRRHQVVRSAIAQSVLGLENLNMGIFWFHNRRDMSGKLYSTEIDGNIDTFLSEHYSRFGSGSWVGGGTPTRESLQHAGREYGKQTVRGTLECRKNFTLLFTDGYANNPDITIDAGGADNEAGAPFANKDYSGTLGDIAYYYREALRNNGSKVSGGRMRLPEECGTGLQEPWMDCNTEFHMNTYAVALGMEGQKIAGKGYDKVIDAHMNPPDWGDSDMGFGWGGVDSAQIDDLYHSAVNGKGEYYDAKSSTALVKALEDAMDDIGAQLGSGSNVSFNTTSLRSGGYIYSAQFTSKIWTGTLRAEAIDKDGIISSRKWDAAILLDDRNLSDNPRRIITFNGDGVDFDWGELSLNQKADLKDGGSDELGKARLSYLSGNSVTGLEGVPFRDRGSRLGAIINSSPVFVGEPNKIWPDDSKFGATAYSAYKADKKSRSEVVYVGANDGMLHGFDAQSGEEVIAYIPGFLYSTEVEKGLSALTIPDLDYQSYVDLPLNTSDVYVNGAWRSIVIGGSRAGKPGLFALDVTDPSSFASGSASAITMWEFTDNNLGNMTEAAQITLLKWGENDYRWSAVFSNGYDAPSGKSGLFILDIADTANRKFIDLGSGNGLSPVRLVDHLDSDGNPNSDGVADRAYAGDLDGNLWAFDLTDGADSWTASASFEVLYAAKDADGNAQPITAQPDIARNDFDSTLADPNLLVFFGTGKYLEAADIPQAEDASDAQPQTFYGISDRGTNVNATNVALSRSDLVKREFTGGSVTVDGESVPVRKTDGEALEDWSTKFGWYVDLPGGGERVVEPPRVRGEFIVFASTIPTGGDPCGGGGSSFLTALQLDGSTDPNKAIIDVNNDGKLDGTDEGWAGVFYGDGIITSFALIDDLALTSDSGAKKSAYLTNFGGGTNATGRIGWTELVDF